MKISKEIIKKELKKFVIKKTKNKKINSKINEKIDLIKKGLLDSIDFLDLISFMEKKFKIEIDLSDENAKNFSKINSLTNSIFKNQKK